MYFAPFHSLFLHSLLFFSPFTAFLLSSTIFRYFNSLKLKILCPVSLFAMFLSKLFVFPDLPLSRFLTFNPLHFICQTRPWSSLIFQSFLFFYCYPPKFFLSCSLSSFFKALQMFECCPPLSSKNNTSY